MLTPATSRKSKPKMPPPGAVLMDYDGLAVIGFPVAGVWGPVGRYWHFNPRLGRWVARQPGEFCRFTKRWFWMRQFGHLLPLLPPHAFGGWGAGCLVDARTPVVG